MPRNHGAAEAWPRLTKHVITRGGVLDESHREPHSGHAKTTELYTVSAQSDLPDATKALHFDSPPLVQQTTLSEKSVRVNGHTRSARKQTGRTLQVVTRNGAARIEPAKLSIAGIRLHRPARSPCVSVLSLECLARALQAFDAGIPTDSETGGAGKTRRGATSLRPASETRILDGKEGIAGRIARRGSRRTCTRC